MGARRMGAQKCRAFQSPAIIFIRASLSWGSSRIVGAVQGRIPHKVRLWASLGVRVVADISEGRRATNFLRGCAFSQGRTS